jgi:hypothetical protein
MRSTLSRAQLALEWTDRIRWDELPLAARAELHVLLRALLGRVVHGDDRVADAPSE